MGKISRPSTGRHRLAFVLFLVLVAVGICVPVFALLPSLTSHHSLPRDDKVRKIHTFGAESLLLDVFSIV